MTITNLPTADPVADPGVRLRIATVATSLSASSVSTRGISIVEGALRALGTEVDRVDIVNFPVHYVGLADAPAEWAAASATIADADAVVIGLGIHGWAPSAVSKAAIELLGSEMAGKPVAFVAGMGSTRSHLLHVPLAVSLVAERECIWVPTALEVTSDTVDTVDTHERAAELAKRLIVITRGLVVV
jgi:NAD(P)H-dependent FMN reductase